MMAQSFTTMILLSIMINLTISSRRLLQIGTNPNINPVLPQIPPPQLPQIPQLPSIGFPNLSPYITGFWSQQCLAIEADMLCTAVGQIATDAGTGTVECSLASSCCVCKQVLCGYEPPPNNRYCDALKVGATNGLYGVKQVAIKGEVGGSGAVLDCSARGSCASTYIMGEWLMSIICGGPDACRDSVMDIKQSTGITCSTRSCIGTTFNLLSNRGGSISCEAPEACMAAKITIIGNIQDIKCGGVRGCKDAKITLTNPMEHFQLNCGGQASCQGLSIDLIIDGPAATTGCTAIVSGQPSYIEWKGITCGSMNSCQGLILNVINNGCRPIRIEDFICIAGQSCTGSNFNFNAGSSPYPLALQNCACGSSCNQATGVDLCFNNIHILECLDINSCSNQQRLLTNIANGFVLLCPNQGSCFNLGLTLSIAGASQNIIQRITAFDCSGYGACSGLTVNIQNMQIFGQAQNQIIEIVIGAIICAQEYSCQDATFITGPGVQIDNIFCALSNSCDNCFIKTYPNDPNPQPCKPTPADLQPQIITPQPSTTTTTAAPVTTTANPISVVPIPDIPSIPSIPSIPAVPQCIGAYGQCGGLNYIGETCCIDGYICIWVNEELSQCELEATPIAVDPNSMTQPPVDTTTTTSKPNSVPIPDIPSIPSIPAIPDIPVVVPPVKPASTSATSTTTTASANPNPNPIPDIPSIPSVPGIPDLPPAGVPGNPSFIPIDIPQTGGAPAPPQIDQLPVDPISNPIIPVVQTGGTVIQTGNTNTNTNTNTNNNGAGAGAIIPPSV